MVDRGVQTGALPALLGGGATVGRAALEDTLSGERYGFATVEALAAFLLRLVGDAGGGGDGRKEGDEGKEGGGGR